MTLTIVTAAYNEYPKIINLINEWILFLSNSDFIENFEIIVVDDFSDESHFIPLKETFKDEYRVIVLRNDKNEGPGYSLNRAIQNSSYNWTIITDSDGQFPIQNLNNFKPYINDGLVNIIFTHRNKKYDNIFNILGQKISNYICNKIYKTNLIDFSCAFKCVKSDILKRLKFDARYMNYSLDHTSKLLLTNGNFIDLPIITKKAKSRKRGFAKELTRGVNRCLYIFYLFYFKILLHRRIIF